MTDVSRQLLDLLATLWFVIARVTPAFIAQTEPLHSPDMFNPQSTPAHSISDLSILVLEVTGIIFVVVVTLLFYAILKYRKRAEDNDHEPPQVFGSHQIELAWTVLPILAVLILPLISNKNGGVLRAHPTFQQMQRFWMDRRQILSWDYFRVARDPPRIEAKCEIRSCNSEMGIYRW